MKKLLFIYNNPLDGSYGGSQGTKKALLGLKQNFDVIEYSCIKQANKYATLWRNLCGYSGNLSSTDCKKVLKILSLEEFDYVYFDVSLHGRLVHKIRKAFPNIKVVVNYHNCEAQYFGDMYRQKGSLYYPIYKAAVKNELLSTKYADFHVFITNEDRFQLGIEKNYCVIPVTLEDKFSDTNQCEFSEPYMLFVGAAQYANIEGAKFIIEKIAPFVDKKCLIVGKGMKSVFCDEYKNVEIMDFVPSLSDVYKNASVFLSPLFSGSGAKVKVAEALMYGKRIIGTPLSFFGYEMESAEYAVCKSAQDFIEEIKTLDMGKKFYVQNRKLFVEKYSAANNARYYAQITNDMEVEKNV